MGTIGGDWKKMFAVGVLPVLIAYGIFIIHLWWQHRKGAEK
jgi:hypothetical protein